MLQNKIKINIIKNYLIGLLAFTLPINKNFQPIIIVAILFFTIIEVVQNGKINNLKSSLFICSISLYLLHLIGMLYTNNYKIGSFDLEQKLSLLIFPIVFFSEHKISEEITTNILRLFIWGNLCAALICLVFACYQYYLFANPDYFFYTQFSVILHPSYFSMYLNFCLIIVLFYPKLSFFKYSSFLMIPVFSIIILLNASKTGIICLFLVLFFKFCVGFIQKKQRVKLLAIASILIASISLIPLFSPKILKRFTDMSSSVQTTDKELNSTSIRLAIWKHSLSIIGDNILFGFGTGDVKEQLELRYNQPNEKILATRKLNAHNQYLQTSVALGIVGLISLLLPMVLVIKFTFKTQQFVGTLFVLLIVINLFFESMLETQAGVVFISFFLFLFLKKASSELTNLKVTI